MEGTFQIIFHLQLTQQFRVDQEVQAGPGLPVQQIGKKKNIEVNEVYKYYSYPLLCSKWCFHGNVKLEQMCS